MVTRNDTLADPRQRSARTDADMRDGDSGRGNPYESDGDDPTTTDRDVGDARPTTDQSDLDATAAEVVTTPASTPEVLEDTFGDESATDEKRASPHTVDDNAGGRVGTAAERGDENMTDKRRVHTAAGYVEPEAGPAGADPKRQREFAELRDEFKEEGRYKGREEEVAARIVNKQRREFGETKEQQAGERKGQADDAGLPVERYQHLTVPQIVAQAEKLGHDELQQLLKFERSHRRRKTLITKMERLAKAAGKGGNG